MWVQSHLCVFFYNQIKECVDHSALPMDGATLTEALHQRGINVRYLGTVLEFVDKTLAKDQLEHFYVSLICPKLEHCHQTRFSCRYNCTDASFSPASQRIGIIELITRCAKHIFKTYLQVCKIS